MSHILVTGASGLVGSHVARTFVEEGHVVTGTWHEHSDHMPLDRDSVGAVEMDLSDDRSIETAFRAAWPEVVVHCAAMSQPELCEKDKELATRINVEGSVRLARICAAFGSRLIFCSTDHVFDGESGDYMEDAIPKPIQVYGGTKREAELEILRNHSAATILRICLVYGRSPGGDRSASEKVVRALKAGEPVRLFTDEYRTPVLVDDVARVVVEIVPDRDLQYLHVAGPDRVSRHEFGVRVAEAYGLDPSAIEAVKRDDVETTPPRPADLSLNARRLSSTARIPPKSLKDALEMLAKGDGER